MNRTKINISLFYRLQPYTFQGGGHLGTLRKPINQRPLCLKRGGIKPSTQEVK